MAIKKGDFVEMDFTGKIVETDVIFDTSIEAIAKQGNIFQEKATYGPVRVVIGERHVVPGLDDDLVGKEPGRHRVVVKPEDAFGNKKPELLKIIPMKHFKKQNIKPFVGLEVNVDGLPGIVRSLSGGRAVVDFNHPLSGKDLEYEVNVKKIITDNKEKVEAMLGLMQLPFKELKVEGKKGTIDMGFKIPDQIKTEVPKEIERLTGIKVTFKEPKEEKEKKEKS